MTPLFEISCTLFGCTCIEHTVNSYTISLFKQQVSLPSIKLIMSLLHRDLFCLHKEPTPRFDANLLQWLIFGNCSLKEVFYNMTFTYVLGNYLSSACTTPISNKKQHGRQDPSYKLCYSYFNGSWHIIDEIFFLAIRRQFSNAYASII